MVESLYSGPLKSKTALEPLFRTLIVVPNAAFLTPEIRTLPLSGKGVKIREVLSDAKEHFVCW